MGAAPHVVIFLIQNLAFIKVRTFWGIISNAISGIIVGRYVHIMPVLDVVTGALLTRVLVMLVRL